MSTPRCNSRPFRISRDFDGSRLRRRSLYNADGYGMSKELPAARPDEALILVGDGPPSQSTLLGFATAGQPPPESERRLASPKRSCKRVGGLLRAA